MIHRSCFPIRHRRPASRAFSLIELMIVLMILAILAALVIPQFTSASNESRINALKMNLFRIRQQIDVYKQEHGEFPTIEDFALQLTRPTDPAGNPVAHGTQGALGPYLREIPVNPMNDQSTISAGEPGSSGWYYDQTTGDFHANDSEASRAF